MSLNNPIALIMATKLEADPFIERLAPVLEAQKPFLVYRNKSVVLIISGIGKVNAAIATAYAFLTYRAEQICNLGAAGAVKPGFALGDMLHIDSVIDYDRPHLRSEKIRILKPLVLEGFQCATVATQDKPVVDPGHRTAMAACTDLVEMEAAGVVQASKAFGVPCTLFKFVSDTVDHEQHDNIVEHIEEYRGAFCDYILEKVLPVLILA